jgi:hypothetical protein
VRPHAWKRYVHDGRAWWLCARCRCREWSEDRPRRSARLGGLWVRRGAAPDRTMALTPADCDEALVKGVMES